MIEHLVLSSIWILYVWRTMYPVGAYEILSHFCLIPLVVRTTQTVSLFTPHITCFSEVRCIPSRSISHWCTCHIRGLANRIMNPAETWCIITQTTENCVACMCCTSVGGYRNLHNTWEKTIFYMPYSTFTAVTRYVVGTNPLQGWM